MASARPDVGYLVLSVDRLLAEDPARVGAVLRGVTERVDSGELEPLPYRRYPLSEAGVAMEEMREARHVGKLVLAPSALAGGGLRSDRSYLVTGGLGGIGIAVAGWLAERGAGAIVLNGRRDPDPAALAAIERLRARDLTVRVAVADVSNVEAVERMLGEIGPEFGVPELGGVIHSVGTLSDRSLSNQDWPSFAQVLWPKLLGAWNLHRATGQLDLDLFVLFSSFSGVIGNPGQANYAAANAFLDQLARHRRSQGLAGQAIAWGAWSGLGQAEERRERLERGMLAGGARWITPEQGLLALERLIRSGSPNSSVVSVDWSVALGTNPPAWLGELVPVTAQDVRSDTGWDLARRIRELPAEDREAALVDFVLEELQSVLRLAAAPSTTVGFFDLGMDSLMAVEFRNRLNRGLAGAYSAPSNVVFDHPTPLRLAQHLLSRLFPASESEARSPGVDPDAEQAYERVRKMGEEDFLAAAEAMLDSE